MPIDGARAATLRLGPEVPNAVDAVVEMGLFPAMQNDYRALGMGYTMLTHRSQQHASDLAPAAAADHQQIGTVGGPDQHGSRVALDDGCVDGKSRMGLSDWLEKGIEGDLIFVIRVVAGGYRRPSVAGGPFPRDESIKADSGELGLIGCPLEGLDRGH